MKITTTLTLALLLIAGIATTTPAAAAPTPGPVIHAGLGYCDKQHPDPYWHEYCGVYSGGLILTRYLDNVTAGNYTGLGAVRKGLQAAAAAENCILDFGNSTPEDCPRMLADALSVEPGCVPDIACLPVRDFCLAIGRDGDGWPEPRPSCIW